MTADKPTIEPLKNGPFKVTNITNLKNHKGEPIEIKPIMTLCRCGGSANKPFCDGQHWYVEFKDPDE